MDSFFTLDIKHFGKASGKRAGAQVFLTPASKRWNQVSKIMFPSSSTMQVGSACSALGLLYMYLA